MILFGLGTLPMMLIINWLGNLISNAIRNKINKVVPYLIVIIGAVFILRGLTLGIPFISPPAEKMTPSLHVNKMTTESASDAVKHSCCQPDTKVK